MQLVQKVTVLLQWLYGSREKYFFDVDIENKKMFSVRKECKKCNILPLCLGGCIIQYNLRAGACTYEKYELKNILISYIKHIS